MDNLNQKKTECYTDKSKVYKAREKCKTLFDTVDEMKELECAETAYQNGDYYFATEHNQWTELESKLSNEGYTFEEVVKLQEHYRKQIADVNKKVAAVNQELSLGKSIMNDNTSMDVIPEKQEEKNKNMEKEQKRQPNR